MFKRTCCVRKFAIRLVVSTRHGGTRHSVQRRTRHPNRPGVRNTLRRDLGGTRRYFVKKKKKQFMNILGRTKHSGYPILCPYAYVVHVCERMILLKVSMSFIEN